MNLLGAILIVVFGFLFVTVSSRLTGEIGSSSNPISGMTVATLLLTCLIFLIVGWTGGPYYVTALSVGGIVCIAASNGGGTSQALKTGFLVGATPRLQQLAILVGALLSRCCSGRSCSSSTTPRPCTCRSPRSRRRESRSIRRDSARCARVSRDRTPRSIARPTGCGTRRRGRRPGRQVPDERPGAGGVVRGPRHQRHVHQARRRHRGAEVRRAKATLMSYIIKGILDRQLPWGLVLFGVMIAVVLEMAGSRRWRSRSGSTCRCRPRARS